uniref:Uncharacterized protein n=1 Tax=Fagus sylvatica TaxID=28930 RepID=A0A2N9GAP9_FAGSY
MGGAGDGNFNKIGRRHPSSNPYLRHLSRAETINIVTSHELKPSSRIWRGGDGLGSGVATVREPSGSGGGGSEGVFVVVATGIGVGSGVEGRLGRGKNERERGIELLVRFF